MINERQKRVKYKYTSISIPASPVVAFRFRHILTKQKSGYLGETEYNIEFFVTK
jgi:hypothetical protein